jgi:hypothetical protein
VCCRSISGSDANLLSHQTSKAHKLKVGEAKKDKPTAITNFFGPPKPPHLAFKPQPLLLPPPSDKSQFWVDLEVAKAAVDIAALKNVPLPIPKGASTSGPNLMESPQPDLLSRLRVLTANLPLSVPIGRPDEPLACFAVNPKDLIQPGEDAWEDIIDPTFNRVIGFGKTTIDIAESIRRGTYGMDGFCNWTGSCLEHLNISPSLLEVRLDCIMQAMMHLYVYFSVFLELLLKYNSCQRHY